MNISFVFQRPICITVSGTTPFETANVAPVGLNDLALKPLSARPAKLITSSKMFDILLLEIALYGGFNVSNNGFVSVGRTAAVLSMYSRKHDTGSIIMSSKFGGMLT